jgi:hypothetical protein
MTKSYEAALEKEIEASEPDDPMYPVGSEVYWNDPDDGACSRHATIKEVKFLSSDGNTTYVIDDGTEVFEYELE